MTRDQDVPASRLSTRNIHHDRIIEKLEIARTLGLITDYRVSATEAPGQASVTARPSATATDSAAKEYLAQLLDGLVVAANIAVTPVTGAAEVRKLMPASDQATPALRARTVHLHRLAAAAAMLICAAIVLDLAPFAKAPKPVPVETGTPAALIVADTDAARSPTQPSIADMLAPTRVAESVEALPESLRIIMQLPFAIAEAAPDRSASDTVSALPVSTAQAAEPPAIVGVWAPDAGTCSARDFKDGLLPTVINSEGAWAGETFCLFTRRKETESGWTVVAKCSTPRERWTSNVRITVSDNRLIWTSKRGTQAYTRCRPDVLMAQAR